METIYATTPYTSEIKGTLGGANVTSATENYIYASGVANEITLYANKNVKKASVKAGSIVSISSGGSSINYKLKGDTTVVNFTLGTSGAGGVFDSFGASRNSTYRRHSRQWHAHSGRFYANT